MSTAHTLRKIGNPVTLVVRLPEGVHVRPCGDGDDYEVVVDPAVYVRRSDVDAKAPSE